MTRSPLLPPPRGWAPVDDRAKGATAERSARHRPHRRGSRVRERVGNIWRDVERRAGLPSPHDGVGSRIEHVLDMSRDAFVETDARGVLTQWNRQSEVLF